MSDPTPEEINTQMADALDGVGLPTSIAPAVLQAVDAAGYNLTPQAGGSALAATTSLSATIEGVDGKPGWFIVTIDGTIKVLEIYDAKTGAVQRHVL